VVGLVFIDVAALDAVMFSWFWLNIDAVRECLARDEKAAFSQDVDITPLLDLQIAYNPNSLRVTFFAAGENATIMMPNLQDGCYTLFRRVAAQTKARSFYACIMDDSKLLNPSNYLYYIDGARERVVYTMKEDRWVFMVK
jgi:hypothetical protein